MTIPQKMAQLEALMAPARSLGWETMDPAEVDEVHARWNRLVAIDRGRRVDQETCRSCAIVSWRCHARDHREP